MSWWSHCDFTCEENSNFTLKYLKLLFSQALFFLLHSHFLLRYFMWWTQWNGRKFHLTTYHIREMRACVCNRLCGPTEGIFPHSTSTFAFFIWWHAGYKRESWKIVGKTLQIFFSPSLNALKLEWARQCLHLLPLFCCSTFYRLGAWVRR